VNFFMNKFRKLGFIEYNGKIVVNKSLLKGCPSRVTPPARIVSLFDAFTSILIAMSQCI